MKEATLCFVVKGDEILMINRNKPPFMGLWNALGGKKKEGESIEDCAKREILEECKIAVKKVELLSRFTWNYDDEVGYAFVCFVDNESGNFPLKTDEGIVDYKKTDWILDKNNYGVIDDLRIFVKDIKMQEKHNYHLIYDGKTLIKAIKLD